MGGHDPVQWPPLAALEPGKTACDKGVNQHKKKHKCYAHVGVSGESQTETLETLEKHENWNGNSGYDWCLHLCLSFYTLPFAFVDVHLSHNQMEIDTRDQRNLVCKTQPTVSCQCLPRVQLHLEVL